MAFNALDLDGVRLYWLDGGGFRFDGGTMFGPVPRPRWSELYPPAEDNSVALTAHVVLVQVGSSWGLLDSGFGHHLSDRQRRFYTLERQTHLDQSLTELGISVGSIDWVILSHLHLDHAGGVLGQDDQHRVAPAFPNAPIWVQTLEAREARDESNRAHGMYTGDAFDRLEELGLIRAVDGQADVTPEVSVFLTGGHSRGHQGTLIKGAAGAGLVYLGDLLVTRAHLPPAWVSALDDFPLEAIRAKREWLSKAAQQAWWVAFSHDVEVVAGLLDAQDSRKLRQTWGGHVFVDVAFLVQPPDGAPRRLERARTTGIFSGRPHLLSLSKAERTTRTQAAGDLVTEPLRCLQSPAVRPCLGAGGPGAWW
ncbi:MAG: MBL fold metallo-hydrolase [Chloroflexi bacterium]|nr:MBL fold metallo-hydrolase [Chloroflexota bacterium]